MGGDEHDALEEPSRQDRDCFFALGFSRATVEVREQGRGTPANGTNPVEPEASLS